MANETNKTRRKDIRFPYELIDKIESEAEKKNVTFSAWVKEACMQRLKRDNKIKLNKD